LIKKDPSVENTGENTAFVFLEMTLHEVAVTDFIDINKKSTETEPETTTGGALEFPEEPEEGEEPEAVEESDFAEEGSEEARIDIQELPYRLASLDTGTLYVMRLADADTGDTDSTEDTSADSTEDTSADSTQETDPTSYNGYKMVKLPFLPFHIKTEQEDTTAEGRIEFKSAGVLYADGCNVVENGGKWILLYANEEEHRYLFGYSIPLKKGETTQPLFDAVRAPAFIEKDSLDVDTYIDLRAYLIQSEWIEEPTIQSRLAELKAAAQSAAAGSTDAAAAQQEPVITLDKDLLQRIYRVYFNQNREKDGIFQPDNISG
jgi:hypothetical protein